MNSTNTESRTLDVEQEIEIKAAPGDVYEGLIDRLTNLEGQDGVNIPFVLERWPGGRWFRDLGNGQGHLWGFVQSIKPPTLIEFIGPMFMSYPVSGHLIARLTPIPGGTKVSFRHRAYGLIEEDHMEGVKDGWDRMFKRLKKMCEG